MELSLQYYEGECNHYEANFFRIFLKDITLAKKITESSDEALGSLLHEYTHYIQSIITLCGIRKTGVYLDIYLDYRICLEDNDKIHLPLKIEESFNSYNQLQELAKLDGYNQERYGAERVEIVDGEIAKAKEEYRAVKIKILDNDGNSIDDSYKFGYLQIIEGMADLIQNRINPNYVHDEVKYKVLKLICETCYPKILEDEFKLIVICYCTLMLSNPGASFFEVLQLAKDNDSFSGLELYTFFMNGTFDNGIKPAKILADSLMHLFGYLEQFLGYKSIYYGQIFKNISDEAMKGENLFLEKLADKNFSRPEIDVLFAHYGLPYVEADYHGFFPVKENGEKYPEPPLFLAVECLIKRLECKSKDNGNHHECPRADFCKVVDKRCQERDPLYLDMYGYECTYDQWNHTDPRCFVKTAFEYFKISKKTFEVAIE